MPLDFPDSPSTNDTFTSGGITWKYDGAKWRLVTGSITAASAGTITGSNAEGTSTSFARADHDHAFGNKSIPPLALPTRCGCVVKHSADQTIANTTVTQLSFNGEDLDTDGFHVTSGSDNKFIKVPTGLAGVYAVFAYIRWESQTVTAATFVLQLNGNAITRHVASGVATGYVGQNISWVGYLAENDQLSVAVYHSAGGNRNVSTVSQSNLDPISPTMGAFRLGGLS